MPDNGGTETESWEGEDREPLLYEDEIPDLWVEANRFVNSLYTVNLAMRRWWAAKKEAIAES